MNEFTPILDGIVRGVICGVRESGLMVGRGVSGNNIHLVPPASHLFAPSVWQEATRRGLALKADGRVVVDGTREDPMADVAAFERLVEERGWGGIVAGEYGVYTVARGDRYTYTVTCQPSGRASLKRIGVWTGTANTFVVSFEHGEALANLLERATTAKMKGETTTIALPAVAGLSVAVAGGEVLIGEISDTEERAILRAVPTLRWDPTRTAYAVSTRYSKRVAKALEEIIKRRDNAAHIAATLASEWESAFKAAWDAEPVTGQAVTVRKVGEYILLRFAYHERAVAAVKTLRGAKFNDHAGDKHWSVHMPPLDHLRRVVAQIDAILSRPAAQPQGRAQSQPAKPTTIRQLWPVALLPALGKVMRAGGQVVAVEGYGKRLKITEDHPSYEGSHLLGYEGSMGCYVYFRPATPAEAEAAPATDSRAAAHTEKLQGM